MCRGSRLVVQAIASLAVALACGVLATGCGSTDAVVRFEGPSHGSIARSTLDHWMQAVAGADIQHNLGAEGPTGLVSDPADYRRCVAAAKLVGPRSFFNQLRFDHAQAMQKCHELHEAIKAQALSFLIGAHWTMAEAFRRGIPANAAEVRSALGNARGGTYPPAAELGSYLKERHWSLSDLLFQVRLELLAERLQGSSIPDASSEAVAHPSSASAILAREQLHIRADKTFCEPGYVVPGCSEYRGSVRTATSPDTLIERLTGKRPGEPAGPR